MRRLAGAFLAALLWAGTALAGGTSCVPQTQSQLLLAMPDTAPFQTITPKILRNFVCSVPLSGSDISAFTATPSGGVPETLAVIAARVNAAMALRVITASGAVTATASDHIIIINKTTGSATSVTLPSSPIAVQSIVIKDGKGDAATNPITIAGIIDGQTSFVINIAYQAVELVWNGTSWSVI
jgi:hypothetical protein